jgi:NAD(P)-dependent dehydrogenase (short-subunit alcohol dehydrogenase family)
VAETLQRFGRVDIAVNNAGGAESFSPFHELTDDQFLKTWQLNFLSAVRNTRAVLPGMRANRWGRIINIASESAVQPDPLGADYNSAKGALNTLTKTLSKAYAAEGILVEHRVSRVHANIAAPLVHRTDCGGPIDHVRRRPGRHAQELPTAHRGEAAGKTARSSPL